MAVTFDNLGQIYPSDFELPLVDHLHERPQPHQPMLQYLIHRKPHLLQPIITQPDLDIRDTESEYVIEVELAGVSDKNAIKLEWTSSRNLEISGNTGRAPLGNETPEPPTSNKLANGTTTTTSKGTGRELEHTQSSESQKPTLLVTERRIGPFQRHFNFPVDVEMEKLKAKLEFGLLRITVPKKATEVGSKGRVNIE